MVNINIVMQNYENKLIADKKVPEFRAGDTVVVAVKVREGTRERIQKFEGVVIARRNRGFNSSQSEKYPTAKALKERFIYTASILTA